MISLLLLSAQSAQKRGPSFWKFNNSLLQDENFIESLEQKLPEFKNKYADLNDKGLLWEMVKMEIRAFSISFSKYKASQKRNEEKQLLQQLNKLQRELDLGFSKTTHDLFITVKEKLDKIISTKTKGCIIRSKCRWYERGERSNKYFFNLTERNYNRKHITSIKTDKNETITNPKEILNQERKYYEDLYKSINPDIENHKFSKFFNDTNLPSLSNIEKCVCKGLLSKEECLSALKKMRNDKTAGTDGLTAEFYRYFWHEIADGIMVDGFNYGFQAGRLSFSQRQGVISLIPKK